MAIPSTMSDLSTTASSNSPAGSENVGPNMDNYIRAVQAIIKNDVSKGSDISSANALTVPDNGHYFVVTGTTNITSIGNTYNGRTIILKFSGILTLTDSASLILFGANITTAVGDVLVITNESSGVYRAISYSKATDDGVTLADTQTLTNKTIVVANNTITTAASGALAATELNAALAELDSEKAPLASPALTGTPTAPTAGAATGGTQIATNAYADASANQTITLSGDVTGSGEDAITVTVVDDSHNHVVANVDDLQDMVVTAWCNFDGTTAGTNDPTEGNNIDTVHRIAAGQYRLTFTVAMTTANYAPSGMMAAAGNTALVLDGTLAGGATEKTTTTVVIESRNANGDLADTKEINIIFVGGV